MYHILTKEANHDTQPTAIVIYSLIYCEQILEPEEAAKAHQASEFEVFNRVEFEKNMNKLSHCKYHHVDNSNKYVIVSKYSSSKRDLTPDESSTAKKKARVV